MKEKPWSHVIAQWILRYVKEKRDSELEQAIVRVVIGLVLIYYFKKIGFYHATSSSSETLSLVFITSLFVIAATLMATCVYFWPGEKHIRRTLSILLDVAPLTYLLIIGDSHAAPLCFLYQWIVIGYGFRFGKNYLIIALVLALAGFGIVIALAPFWQDDQGLAVGLWLGTLTISMYSSTLIGRLYQALDRAEEANIAKRQFICSVSHELRTPLNAIIGMIDLMRGMQLDKELVEMLDCLTATSQVMLTQIEDVLDFSKIEAGKMSVELVEFDLYKIIQNILDIFRYRVDPFQIQLIHSIGSEVPFKIKGDQHHLKQIMVNLIGNSVKFTEQGSIAVGVNLVRKTDHQIRLRFVVKDTGIGIPANAQDKIFESFTQGDESTTRRFGGTGLGTTICKQLVELMGGEIGFSSTQGEGSEFWFELDFDFDSHTQNISSELNISLVRTLIFSPHSSLTELSAQLEELCGAAPEMATCPEQALKYLEHSTLVGKPVRLIFIDDPIENGESFSDYVKRLSCLTQYLQKAYNCGRLISILLTKDISQLNELVQCMGSSGLYSIVKLPANREALINVLHGYLINSNHNPIDTKLAQPIRESTSIKVVASDPVEDSGYEILVAEDNPTNRKVLQKILERSGHRCTLVKDGDEALDLLEKRTFDAIVLDMNMPKIPGTDVARLYRLMHAHTADIPIILFSANATPEARQESLDAGASAFLAKPIQIEIFLATLDRLVGQFHALHPPSSKLKNLTISHSVVLVRPNELILNMQALNELEEVSKDKKFLDDLISEFMHVNRNYILQLESSLLMNDIENFKEIVHAIKGSSLSIGAVSLKMICKRLEKMGKGEIEAYSQEIIQQIRHAFSLLCEQLENYRQKRIIPIEST